MSAYVTAAALTAASAFAAFFQHKMAAAKAGS